jgi:hypothetical protein
MSNRTSISMKIVNRLKDLAGSVQIGQPIDLCKPPAKGYRIARPYDRRHPSPFLAGTPAR